MLELNIEETDGLYLQFEKRGGLIPVAVKEKSTGQILMLASVDKEAFAYTIRHQVVAFYSTSRKKLWVKGETSGNFLYVTNILVDCDQDALVYQVSLQKGGVCHTFNQKNENRRSCFYRRLNNEKGDLEFLEP